MLDQPMPPVINVAKPLLMRDGIRFEDVRFRYSPDDDEVLRGLNLNIHCGERIGVIGGTGSGKAPLLIY